MAADIGRRQGRAGEKSNFATACSALSQYIKAKGSIADLGLAVASPNLDAPEGKLEVSRPSATMMLLPGADVSGSERVDEEKRLRNEMELFPNRAGLRTSATASQTDDREQKRAQLTIFYGGKVLVFDSFAADMAKNLMQLVSKGTSTVQNSSYVLPSTSAATFETHPTGFPNKDSTMVAAPMSNSVVFHDELNNPAQSSVSDLPIARKSSLKRFLEKRKDRINTKAPYEVHGSPASGLQLKSEEGKSWLGLGQ
ncbi:hypothetical protein Cni_G01931 [Canna indica]|uniref:Protein TIFY n=1 Tax=Canna indica TaxID=4628 RepID=A0AAQ3JRA2_9LILI|nr:hypothetical protein Cni_G01931 [Canna indica]